MTTTIRNAVLGTTAALAFAGAALATAPAQAGGWYGYHHGGAVAAGVIGGLALGAAAASAAAQPVYAPAYAGDCYFVRRAISDDFGNVYVRRVRVCE